LSFTYTVNGGAAQTGTATFDKLVGNGKTAHFNALLPATVTGGTIAITGGSILVAGQRIQLHNTLTQVLKLRAPAAAAARRRAAASAAPPLRRSAARTGQPEGVQGARGRNHVPAGTLFTFTVGTRNVSVAPGTCVLVEALAPGTVAVTETGLRASS
jgi:hypothetical protein